MEFIIPESIEVMGSIFTIIQDPKSIGGSFAFTSERNEITVGVEALKTDPVYVFGILVHELSELVHLMMGTRYNDYGNDGYKFFMDHKEFENHNKILCSLIAKILK